MKLPLAAVAAAALLLVGRPNCGRAAGAGTAPPEVLTQLEDAFTQVAQNTFPAVVVITNKRIERRPMYPPNLLPPEFRFFFGQPDGDEDGAPRQAPQVGKQVPVPVGKGSGIIYRGDGYILTNAHVIEGADALEVRLHDGRIFDNSKDKNEVVVVGEDKETDIALLRIGNGKLKGLQTLVFADSSKVKVGQFAIAIGAPFNFDYSVSVGHVSQKGRFDVHMNTYENYIQTDASINPGNSGGPLLNLRGEVMGINEFIITGGMSRGSVGLGFAIASNLAKQAADSMLSNKGVVVRPWLGLAMQPLTEDLQQQFKVSAGVLVNDVLKGDPADAAGVKAGDVILKVGATDVRTPHDVQFAVMAFKPGDKIPLLLDRGGRKQTVYVTARQKSGKDTVPAAAPQAHGSLDKLGLTLEDGKEGATIAQVAPGSPAAAAQMRRNDVILEVNRRPVAKVGDVMEALKDTANGVAVFYVNRRGFRFYVPIQIGDGNGN